MKNGPLTTESLIYLLYTRFAEMNQIELSFFSQTAWGELCLKLRWRLIGCGCVVRSSLPSAFLVTPD